jgi:hypothetical protein
MAGDRLAPPQTTVQLMRELLETDHPDDPTEPLDAETLVHLLLSITTEQWTREEFARDVPTKREIEQLSEEIASLNQEETIARMHEFLPDEVATMLFNAPAKKEVVQANTYDTWFTGWPDRVTEPKLGATPAEAFKTATGIDLVELLRLGEIITGRSAGTVVNTRADLIAAGASEAAVTYLADHMALGQEGFREALAADRARGTISQQRYTLTQFPFLALPDGGLLLVRHQWGAERLFGSLLYWEAYAAISAQSRSLAARFSEAMDHMFEHQVGQILSRITKRGSTGVRVVNEKQLQAQWAQRRGEQPSVCDWVIAGAKVCVAIDATKPPTQLHARPGPRKHTRI